MPCLFVNNLSAIDCSILDPVRGLIGASWSVDIELYGDLDERSMVFDFSKVKKTIKRVIDQEIDHKLLVPRLFRGCELLTRDNEVEISFTDRQQQTIFHQSPQSAICLLATEQVNSEAVIDFLKKACLTELPSNVDALEIKLHDEAALGSYYCYSHGLKKHQGNCQRIAHGHRSQIQIWLNGDRSTSLEQEWATRWQDIYVGTTADVVSQKDQRIEFSYRSEQGQFMLELPEQRVHLMTADSTVECIAEHIRNLLEIEHPNAQIKVKAFEGIGKGAIA
jgi:6-pyruvoyl-tetrahydropterin synthase